jgi:dTMP kinase
MQRQGYFIVIEGLDGAGKTSTAYQLTQTLQTNYRVLFTQEPHYPSCAGAFIRNVLEKKLVECTEKTLAMAFAANRMDHCTREIKPFLSKYNQGIVICDRYYLSSLVYQTKTLSMDEIMLYNSEVIRPDLIIFLDARPEVCFARMRSRGIDKQLFESNLKKTKEKYYTAIEYLRGKGENIITVSANGTSTEVLNSVLQTIHNCGYLG